MPTTGSYPVTFFATVDTSGSDNILIDLGMYNGAGILPADDDFGAVWELYGPDGEIRAGGRVHQLGAPLAGGNERIFLQWKAVLDPGSYTLTWGAPGYGSTVNRFEVLEKDGRLQIGDHQSHISPDFPPDISQLPVD